ncbi:hypothetical protein BC835DRAFT_1305437 [Cytidiella melzeri]|nr:hypothetical protein BC835DRAFT_1305437 [Cytidiella melzeri]
MRTRHCSEHKREQQQAATSTTKQPDNAAGNDEDGENSNGLNCGSGDDDWPPEDEDNDIIGYESQFQSKGVISVVQPLKQLKCRVNDPKPTPPLFLHNCSESLSPPPSPLTVTLSCTTLSIVLTVALSCTILSTALTVTLSCTTLSTALTVALSCTILSTALTVTLLTALTVALLCTILSSALTVALSCTTLSSALIVALSQSLAAALRLVWLLAVALKFSWPFSVALLSLLTLLRVFRSSVLTSIIFTYLKSSIFSPVRVTFGLSGQRCGCCCPGAPQAYSSVEYKGGSAPTNGRPKESNYTGITATIISRAVVCYQLKVLTESAFPDHDTQHTWARSVFQISCQEVERSYSPDNEAVRGIYLVIIGCASSFRGHLRNKICGKIVETYGLKTDTSKDATAKANAERVAWLLQPIGQAQDANRYCYEEFTHDPPRGLAQVSIIQHALQELVFCGDTSPGAKFSALFDPLPLPTIALLLAMVRFGLMRWETGRLEQKGPEFRETTYGQVVKEHLGQLKDWAKLRPVITTKICHSLFKKILRLGGIERKQDKPLELSDVAKENALQDLDNWVDEDNSN